MERWELVRALDEVDCVREDFPALQNALTYLPKKTFKATIMWILLVCFFPLIVLPLTFLWAGGCRFWC